MVNDTLNNYKVLTQIIKMSMHNPLSETVGCLDMF